MHRFGWMIVLGSVGAVSPAHGQVLELRPAAGIVLPAGALGGPGTEPSAGPSVSGQLRFQPRSSVIGFEGGALIAWLDDGSSATVKQGGLYAGVVLRRAPDAAGRRWWPYAVAGAGLFAGDCRCNDGSFVGWGGYLGGGTDLQVGQVPLFLEVRVNRVITDAEEDVWLIPIVLGLRL